MGCPNLTYRENPTPLKVVYNAVKTSEKGCAGLYRFGYTGHEKLNEVSGIGNTIDMGDRWLDTRLGRTPKPDAKAGKYPFISPYAYALNNPIIYNDPDGKDVYLVIYTTKEEDVGHAAIAVENYKQVTTKVMENGKEVTKTEWVKDGTLTFYELGPQNGIDGKTGALKDVEAFYGKQTVTKDQVFNEALSEYERTAPDGIIKFTTDATTDLSIHKKLGETYQKDKPDYNATSNNCSDYAGCGASEAAGKSIDGKERLFLWIYSTTPNKLFREAAKVGNATIEKDPGQQVNKSFEDAYEGTSSSDDSKKTK